MQVHQVRNESAEHGPILGIGDIVFTAGFSHQCADSRVVDVTDSGEQVMFNLEVQSAQEPKQGPAGRSEISRG